MASSNVFRHSRDVGIGIPVKYQKANTLKVTLKVSDTGGNWMGQDRTESVQFVC